MYIRKEAKSDVDYLYNHGFGIIKFKRFAILKTYGSDKYMFKELGWAIIGLPIAIIMSILEILEKIFDLIPNINIIEGDNEDE